ncbi:DUF6327 family protein [Maribacter sp.]|uniref:DUF6327 family protein n=1 Tax=Maribacter sp. TaxID=1897614 RepID=UPI0025C59C63|nr:DUF6327 family protein [Maribacter sp.]
MIMVKEYKSFEEIDARLKVLKLQREIDQESLKLHFYRAKGDLVSRKLLQGLGATFTHNDTWKNMLLAFVSKRILGIIRKRHHKKTQR